MSGKPTEKMVWRLKRMGLPESVINTMTYEQASEAISADASASQVFKKTINQPQTEFVEAGKYTPAPKAKPTYNPASQYVSYSKDIFLALKAGIMAQASDNPRVVIDDPTIMAHACALVKQAIKEFE